VVDEHRKHIGPGALANYAKGIKIHRVIIHSSLKSSNQLLIKIIDSMFKSGAVMENGKICMKNECKVKTTIGNVNKNSFFNKMQSHVAYIIRPAL
jgi:hypothetical protein